MSLGILNNVAAIYAENNLNATQTSLQTTLQQLSSGSRINSGADDAAGLSLANGLAANSAALSQSSTNAAEGVGLLQVADGALSQVNSLLNRAVTLATEASNGTLNTSQTQAANQEYQSILAEINNIGSTTTYNGAAVFGNTVSIYTGDSSTAGASTDALTVSGLTSGTVGDANGTINSTVSGSTTYVSAAQDPTGTYTGSIVFQQGTAGTPVTVTIATASTINQIATLINNADITGISASVAQVSATAGTYSLDITEQSYATNPLQTFTGAGAADVGALETTAGTAVDLNFAAPSGTAAGISYTAGNSENLSATTLTTTPSTTLTDINAAITDVAGQRGYLGSQINTLNAASNVATTENTNIVSAENSVTATDYGQASSNLSKYEILGQTGISALAQANSVQQEVLKLLQ
jgi:flagellin